MCVMAKCGSPTLTGVYIPVCLHSIVTTLESQPYEQQALQVPGINDQT